MTPVIVTTIVKMVIERAVSIDTTVIPCSRNKVPAFVLQKKCDHLQLLTFCYPFLTNEVERHEKIEVQGLHGKVNVRTKDLIKDEKMLVEMLNKYFVNIIEKRQE